MNKSIVFLLVSIVFFASCKRQPINKTSASSDKDSVQVITSTPIIVKDSVLVTPPVKIAENEEDKVKIDEIDFKYLKAKAKVSFKSPKESQNVNVDIRMKKDSIIWMNISALGFSVASALFDKDIVKFYDKFHGEYNEYTYTDFSEKFKFNIDYDILQSLIVGNRPFKKKKSRVVRENEYYLLKQQEGKVMIDNYIGDNKKLKKLLLTQENTDNKLTLDFDDFTMLNQYLFPNSSLITVDYKSQEDQKMYQTVVNIKHTKVELLDTPLEFPFKVPEKLLKK
ncbi:MAG: DUF4292 domain-containing protein [Arcicella sp.]|jgi:hypothetical protein|nr:DUF4292 domain-containing protein [Arcicella sp.]